MAFPRQFKDWSILISSPVTITFKFVYNCRASLCCISAAEDAHTVCCSIGLLLWNAAAVRSTNTPAPAEYNYCLIPHRFPQRKAFFLQSSVRRVFPKTCSGSVIIVPLGRFPFTIMQELPNREIVCRSRCL